MFGLVPSRKERQNDYTEDKSLIILPQGDRLVPLTTPTEAGSMVRSILATFLAAVLALAPIPAAAGKSLDAVQAIQHNGRTFCTVFSINEDLGYFGSAGHCAMYVLANELEGRITILGQPAEIEMISLRYDIAVFQADVHIPALNVAKHPVDVCNPKFPDACETVTIQGFPYGLPKLITVTGHVAAQNVPILHPSYGIVMYSDILDITTAGGNSGSPVLNSRGEVVGVLWGGFVDSPHSLSVPLASVRAAMLGYFE